MYAEIYSSAKIKDRKLQELLDKIIKKSGKKKGLTISCKKNVWSLARRKPKM